MMSSKDYPPEIPDRYQRPFEYQKERRINVRMTKELHKDMKRILIEQDESWQSVFHELLLYYALTHQDNLPKRIREANLEQTPFSTDKQLKAYAESRIKEFIEKRPVRESFGEI